MLKKIAIFLFVLLIVQMILYARLYAKDVQLTLCISNATQATKVQEGQDYDVEDYIKSLGIETSVDEQQLEDKYKSVKLLTDPLNGNAVIRFYNPQANNYSLDIYDANKGLVASFVNLNSDNVQIDKEVFQSGSYIYKLSGEANIFCGTFILH